MSEAVSPRSVTSPLVADLAIPVVLILFILLGGVLILIGIILGVYYLYRRISDGGDERTGH